MDISNVKLLGKYDSAKVSSILSDKVVNSEGDDEKQIKP